MWVAVNVVTVASPPHPWKSDQEFLDCARVSVCCVPLSLMKVFALEEAFNLSCCLKKACAKVAVPVCTVNNEYFCNKGHCHSYCR